MAVKNIQKYCWPEHSINGWSMAGAFLQVAGALHNTAKTDLNKVA